LSNAKSEKKLERRSAATRWANTTLRLSVWRSRQGGELDKRIEASKIYSPDLNTYSLLKHEDFVGYLLNRRMFGPVATSEGS